MNDFQNMEPGESRTLDWGGETVIVAAETEFVFWVSKYVDGAAWKVAKLTHAPDANAEYPWIVEPMGPLYDRESYSSWGDALRSAARMKVAVGDFM